MQYFKAYSSSEHWSGRGIRYPVANRLTKAIGDEMSGYGNSPVWLKEDHRDLNNSVVETRI